MKTILTLFILLSGLWAFSQNPAIQWQKSLGGSGFEFAADIQQTADGGYVVVGSSDSNNGDVSGNHGGGDYWFVKLNAAGLIQWQKCYGGTSNDTPTSVLQTADGGYVVSGISGSINGDVVGNYSYFKSLWTIKIDSMGVIQWQNLVPSSCVSSSIKQTADGGFIIGAGGSLVGSSPIGAGGSDFLLIKLNSMGVVQWEQFYGGSKDDIGACVQQTSDHGYILAGSTMSNDGQVTGYHGGSCVNGCGLCCWDYWVIKTDSSGALQWQKSLGSTKEDSGYSVVQSSDGGYVVAGRSTSFDGDVGWNYGLEDYWIVKLGASGNIKWQKNYGGSGDDQAFCIQKTSDNGYAIGGAAYTFNDGDVTGGYGNGDFWLLKIDSVGAKQGQGAFGGPSIEESWSMRQTTDGGYVMTGYTYSNNGDVTSNHGHSDFWVVKLGATVGVKEFEKENPSFKIYPNPATDQINIAGAPVLNSNAIVAITDCFGNLVLKSHNVENIDISLLKSGYYFVEITTPEHAFHSAFVKE